MSACFYFVKFFLECFLILVLYFLYLNYLNLEFICGDEKFYKCKKNEMYI